MKPDFAARYGDLTSWHWWFRGRARILSTVLVRELGVPDAPRRIASIGCGPPEGLAWLLPHAWKGGVVAGVDSDPSGALRKNPPSVPAGVTFSIAAADRPGLEEHSFDAVLALDVLEHLDDDASALSAAAALVKPGGLLLVTVPAGPSLWGAQDRLSEHRRRYTKRDLAESFARAKLRAPRLAYFNSLLYPPIAAVRWSRRLLRTPDSGVSDFENNRPGVANEILARIFSAEAPLVGRIPLPLGVSLLATVRPESC